MSKIKTTLLIGLIIGNLWGQKLSDKAQNLPQKKFKVCGQLLNLEIANSDPLRAKGLMYRSGISEGQGMLFIFPSEQELSFWMRNVPFDIDIGYFNSKGSLVNYLTMSGTSPIQNSETLPSYKSRGKALYAVETVSGFFKKHAHSKKCVLEKPPGRSKD